MPNMTTKKKLCWNCEGQVELDVENCPFCGVYLGPLPSRENGRTDSSLLTPPYKIVETEEDSPLQPPYKQTSLSTPLENSEKASVLPIESGTLYALTFLSAGTLLFFFSLVLLLFSEEGTLTLRWNGKLWYCYLLSALPLLYLGWRFSKSSNPTTK